MKYIPGDEDYFIILSNNMSSPSALSMSCGYLLQGFNLACAGFVFDSSAAASAAYEAGIECALYRQQEKRRANILEVNPDGSGERIYASGLRNPVGMDWAPGSGTLYTVVNERDELGDDLVPDYLTSVQSGGFYGWPYFYFGGHEDPRIKSQDTTLKQRTIKPDLALGSHTASLGLVFYRGSSFPAKYRNGAFIGQRGSWNRSKLSGDKVIFVPFSGGRPSGVPEDFLTGFIADSARSEVFGRPVGVAELKHGALLAADDAGNAIWCIRAQ